MITQLNQKLRAQEQQNFDVLPEGDYNVVVEAIEPWEKKEKKDAFVILRDATGEMVKDDKGKLVKEKVALLEYYLAKMTLRVVGGEHDGRKIFSTLTTYPDAIFTTQGFLYAVGLQEIALGEIPDKCVGLNLDVTVAHREYAKETTNPNTGLSESTIRVIADVKKYIKPSNVNAAPTNNNIDYGI